MINKFGITRLRLSREWIKNHLYIFRERESVRKSERERRGEREKGKLAVIL